MRQVAPLRSEHETLPLSEAAERLHEEANPREVAKYAKSMSPEMLRCRRMRQHKWEPMMAAKVQGGFTETVVCERCGAEKDRTYNSRGHAVDYGTVRYPEGYLFKGLGRLGEAGRDVINLASLNADIQLRFDIAGQTKQRVASKAQVAKPTVSSNGHRRGRVSA